MFNPNIVTMASASLSNDFPFFSYGLLNLSFANNLQCINPIHGHFSHSDFFQRTVWRPSLNHQIFPADMIPQYISLGGGFGYYDQQRHIPAYGSETFVTGMEPLYPIPIPGIGTFGTGMEPPVLTPIPGIGTFGTGMEPPVPTPIPGSGTFVTGMESRDPIPIYGSGTFGPRMDPCNFTLSNSTNLSVVGHVYKTNEWDLLSDSVQGQEISTIMNYMHKQSKESVDLTIPQKVLMSEKRLCESLKGMNFNSNSVKYVYNPLVYAFEPHQEYLVKYCCSEKPILFLGMNPGPLGMVQNGVPFGEYKTVKDWLKVEGEIYIPKHQHSKKPVEGWDMTRSEVSGKRLWGLIQRICGEPKIFFVNCFVHNYCPLAFFDSDGRNISLSDLDLKDNDRDYFYVKCNESLLDILKILNVKLIFCISRLVESSVKRMLKENSLSESIHIEYLLHPSSRNRSNAHENWEANAMQTLIKMKVIKYLKGEKFDKAKWDRERLNPEAQE